ncbi:MAG: agmatine deiminase family protein [Alphaproteobacteria bacterium]|nr:agmatine deiminase family protein [Alphaproteobacteria bacterium]
MDRRKLLMTGSVASLLALFSKEALAVLPDSFVMPAEDARHSATFMQWPVSRQVYPDGDFLAITQQTIADIANTIVEFEPVMMLVGKSHHPQARKHLSQKIELWDIETEDLWARDSGPVFVVGPGGKLAVSQIQFNGWGEKQVNTHDKNIAAKVAQRLGLALLPSGLIGEAGGVEQDGKGLLMAHESSWVNNNRNPDLSRDQIEARLLAAYGAERMIWADGLSGWDITDYHIDGLARFTAPGRVLMNLPDKPDPYDPFHKAALKTHKALLQAGLSVTVIPEPVKRRIDDVEFVASYVNYYVCNGAVIASQFGDKVSDQMAAAALKEHYPGREVIMLNADALGELGGGVHCATQQMPAV